MNTKLRSWCMDASRNSMRSIIAIMTALLLVGGFFIPQGALADATINPASGGTNISIDTTSHPDCVGGSCGTFKTLTGPSFDTENGDIAEGTHTISLPAGWEFNTGSTITIAAFNDIGLESTTATPDETSFSFTVTSQSTTAGSIGFMGLQVRPTSTQLSSGMITHSGADIAGVDENTNDENTNFGTLSTVAGTITQLTFETQPTDAEYGSLLNPQPVVVTQDQFGNDSTNGLVETEMVSLSLTGTGILQGTVTFNIGTGGGTPGTVTFTDLTVDEFGAGKQLTAVATDLTSAVSDNFEITRKPITATILARDKIYDGDDSATIDDRTLIGKIPGEVVDLDEGTATFDTKDVGENKVVSAVDIIISGSDSGNYIYDGTAAGMADVTPKPITVTPDADQSKTYGDTDPVFAYTSDPLIGSDAFTGVLSRVAGEDVDTYAYTLGTLEEGLDNYLLTLVPGTFEITQRQITVTAVTDTKVYNGTTNSAATPEITDGSLAFSDNDDFTQVYNDKNIGTGRILIPDGIVNDGNEGANYNVTFVTDETGVITEKELTVSGLSAAGKTYDGAISADVSGTPALVGVEGSDDVSLEGTAIGEFNTTNAGVNTVPVSGLSLTGAGALNYTLTQPVLEAEILQLEITGSFTTENKVYDGNTTAAVLMQFLAGVLSVDKGNVILTGGVADFADPNVTNGITVAASGMTLSGLAAGNYTLASVDTATADITPKLLTATVSVEKKVVDEDDSAIITDIELQGVVSDDDVVVDFSGATATFADSTVGPHAVTATGITIDGADAGNYSFDGMATGTGEILLVPTTVYVDDDWAGKGAWTDPDGAGDATFFGYDAFDSVQDAIDAVEDGGTVNVLAGTYAESLTIDRTLSIIGMGSTSIIQPAINQDGVVISADDVLIKDLKISTLNSGDNPNIAVSVQGTMGVEINNNVIETTGDKAMGIWVGGSSNDMDPSTNLTIVGNSINIDGEATGIYAAHSNPAHSGWLIGGSEADGNAVTAENGNPIELYDVTASEVNYNTITTSASGGSAVIWSSELSSLSSLTFSNNSVDFSGGSQVAFLTDFILGDGNSTVSGVTVLGNTFNNWGLRGLRIGNGVTLVTADENKFLGTGEALNNEDTSEVNAKNNWWGTAVLSTIDGKTNGTIDFEPYYVESGMTLLSNVPVTAVYVDDNYSDGAGNDGHYFGHDAFATIQEGMDAVADGGSVNVEAGTYDEQLQINKNVTISDVTGTKGATIQPTGDDSAWDIQFTDGGSSATLSGFTLDFDGPSDDRPGRGIGVSDLNGPAVTDVTIEGNDIMMGVGTGAATVGLEGVGIQTGRNADVGGLQILNNIFHGRSASITDGDTEGEEGIYINPTTGTGAITISGNTFSGGLFTGISVEADNVTVSGNTVTGNGSIQNTNGIRVNDFGIGSDYTVTISGNTVSGFENGLRLGSASDNSSTLTISVLDNIITGNTVGIFAKHDAVVTASENSISGNDTGAEILDGSDGSLNAIGNWWDHETGPTHTSNAGGSGDTVSDGVEYRPWYTTAAMDDLDSTTPTVALTYGANPAGIGSMTITVTYSEAILSTPQISIDQQGTTDVSNVEMSGSGAVWTYDYTVTIANGSEYVDGTATVSLSSVNDPSGNIAESPAGNTFTIDTIAPTATLSGTPASLTNNTGTDITAAGTDVTAYRYSLDGGVYGTETSVATDITLSGLTDGERTLSVIGRDEAGNWQLEASATTHTWTVDTQAPVVVITAPTAEARVNGATVISFTDDDLTVAECSIDNLTWVACTSETTTLGNVTGFDALTDGNVTLYLRDTDTAGNAGTAQVALVKDTTVPSVTSKTPSANVVGVAPTTNITVVFNEDVVITNAEVTLQKGFDATINTVVSGTETITIDPAVTLDNNSTYTITLTGVTDTAGNALPTTSWSFTTAASYSINLTTGWNLISLPVVPANTSVSNVLGDLNDPNRVQGVWQYDATNEEWKVYRPNDLETSDFSTMTAGTGYWIDYIDTAPATIAGTGNLFLEGSNTPPQKTLAAGWNLIGYFQLENTTSVSANNALSTISDQWTQIRTYSNSSKQFQAVTGSDLMGPGQGFWIFMKSSSFAPYLYGPGETN